MPPQTPLPPVKVARPELVLEAVEVVGQSELAPGDLSAGSNRTVLWRCTACRSEWTASVAPVVAALRALWPSEGGHGRLLLAAGRVLRRRLQSCATNSWRTSRDRG